MIFGGSSSKRSAASGDGAGDAQVLGRDVWFRPDDTFRSFCALLEAPAVSHAHIALIGPQALTSTVANYMAALTHEHVAEFVKLIANSPCLWASYQPAEDTNASPGQLQQKAEGSGAPALPLLQDRTDQIIQAVGQAVGQRIALTLRSRYNSTGWQTRRILASWVSSVLSNSQNDVSELPDSQDLAPPFELLSLYGEPIARLAIATGLLAGLQGANVQWEKQGRLGIDVRYHIKLAETGWAAAFAACLEVLERRQRHEQRAAAAVPLHCAVQVMPFINSRRLESLPAETLLRVTADRLLHPIEDSRLLSSLSADVRKDDAGLVVLESTSPTAQRVKALQDHSAFRAIAPLSRILSGTLARLARKVPPAELGDRLFGSVTEGQALDGASGADAVIDGSGKPTTLLRRLQTYTQQLETEWWSSELALCTEADLAEQTKPVTKELWTVFKTLLFSITMIFDSLVDAIVDMCPSPTVTVMPAQTADGSSAKWGPVSTSNIPAQYLQCMHAVQTTYAHTYWITVTFGHDGFDVYRSVFYSSLDVLGRDGEACVALLEALVPHLSYGPERLQVSTATHFMLVAEQIVGVLPDDMIEKLVLPICKPYLHSSANKYAFESAHTVLLAVFANDKDVAEKLAPFYLQLLLSIFPSELNVAQFEHAFTTVMNSISDRDDALAWWAMDLLAQEIENEREASKSGAIAGQRQVANTAGVDRSISREVELQLVYVAQISTVNLVLLRSLLAKVRRYIVQYPIAPISIPGLSASETGTDQSGRGEDEVASTPVSPALIDPAATARQRLAEKAFDALSGLDASTREEGLRWWLDNRGVFGV